MKCPECNKDNKNNSKFCVRCGAPLTKTKNKLNLKRIGIAVAIIICIISIFIIVSSYQATEVEYPTTEVEGVTFTIPAEGYYKEYNKYRFIFNGHNCTVNGAKHFESSNSTKTMDSIKLEKYYPGAETYQSHFIQSGNSWYGLKLKKDNIWFHVAIQNSNEAEAIEFFDWMYEHNDWEGHEDM